MYMFLISKPTFYPCRWLHTCRTRYQVLYFASKKAGIHTYPSWMDKVLKLIKYCLNPKLFYAYDTFIQLDLYFGLLQPPTE